MFVYTREKCNCRFDTKYSHLVRTQMLGKELYHITFIYKSPTFNYRNQKCYIKL